MTFDWKRLAGRIDDMSLRERAMIFASIGLVILVFAHVALIDPVLRKQKSLIDRVSRDQMQLNTIRSQIEQIVKSDAGAQARHPDEAAIEGLERRLAEAEREMASRQGGLIAPERLPALLKEILGRSQAVRLESLRLQPGVPLAAGRGKPVAGLYRHGVEVTLKGSYFDLLRYLEELEKRSAVLLWGKVELVAERYPEVELRIVVQTLSPNASLLTI